MEKNKNRKTIICVIGLGYVGLQVAIAFSKKYKVIGYDKSIQRINELKKINDKTNEVSFLELKNSNVKFTLDKLKIKKANLYIVAVPTPILLCCVSIATTLLLLDGIGLLIIAFILLIILLDIKYINISIIFNNLNYLFY